jgi:N utilization substance protein A
VPWSQDPSVFVSRALSPAKVMDVRVHEPDKRMVVVVADDQLSLAIGKGGQNARLAARLTGWKIDLISKTDEKKRQDHERASRIEIEKLELGDATTEKLISAGIETVHELAATPLERLVEIPGVGEKTAEKLLAAALEYLKEHPPAAPAELAFTPEMEGGEAAPVDGGAPEASVPSGDAVEAMPEAASDGAVEPEPAAEPESAVEPESEVEPEPTVEPEPEALEREAEESTAPSAGEDGERRA